MQFIDEVEIIAVSGKGGDGSVHFRREKYVPRGGPDGGDGGRGGSVVFEASSSRNTLIDYRRARIQKASNGQPGVGKQMTGASGEDRVCLVPVGTVIYDAESDEELADLTEEGARWILPGGRGGLGNMHFKTSTNQTPRRAIPGEEGQEKVLRLELKLLADIGLLGFPNAGKSTTLARVTAATPRIANYPFTTLVPQLGVVPIGLGSSFVLADIPGLIEGASEGAGLGHQFLKHVERCAAYLHLVSPEPHDGDGTERTPVERLQALDDELEAYHPELLERPQIVVLSKTDLLGPEEVEAHLEALREVTDRPVFAMSAVSGDGVTEVIRAAWQLLTRIRDGEEGDGSDDEDWD